jgi:hypothetical protein
MTVEEIADELVKVWSSWSVNYDAVKMIEELDELYRRLGLDPRGADRTLFDEARLLAGKKMVAKGWRFDIILMDVRPDSKPRQEPEENP